MKKISRRNFLLASGVVTDWCCSGSLRRRFFQQHRCFLCGSRILRCCFCSGCCRGQGAEHLVLE